MQWHLWCIFFAFSVICRKTLEKCRKAHPSRHGWKMAQTLWPPLILPWVTAVHYFYPGWWAPTSGTYDQSGRRHQPFRNISILCTIKGRNTTATPTEVPMMGVLRLSRVTQTLLCSFSAAVSPQDTRLPLTLVCAMLPHSQNREYLFEGKPVHVGAGTPRATGRYTAAKHQNRPGGKLQRDSQPRLPG